VRDRDQLALFVNTSQFMTQTQQQALSYCASCPSKSSLCWGVDSVARKSACGDRCRSSAMPGTHHSVMQPENSLFGSYAARSAAAEATVTRATRIWSVRRDLKP